MRIAGSLPRIGGAGGGSRRQWILGAIALALTLLTIWDYSAPKEHSQARRQPGNAAETAPVANGSESIRAGRSLAPDPWQEAARLRQLLDSAKIIRQRYNTIAVPYAEAVAGFAGLHSPGQTSRDAAEQAVRSLVPNAVELKDILIAESPASASGVTNLKATVSLASSNSHAIMQAILALGDAANGMIWKSFSLGVDSGNRQLLVKGELSIITVEQAE